jgi:hypothetical protein
MSEKEYGPADTLTVLAMNEASSPCAVYQSPLSKTLTVSFSWSGRALKNLMNPPSSSTYVKRLVATKNKTSVVNLELWS